MKQEDKCICHFQLGYSKDTAIICHLSWCPQSYVYQEDMARYKKAPWYKKPFMYKPWNHPFGV